MTNVRSELWLCLLVRLNLKGLFLLLYMLKSKNEDKWLRFISSVVKGDIDYVKLFIQSQNIEEIPPEVISLAVIFSARLNSPKSYDFLISLGFDKTSHDSSGASLLSVLIGSGQTEKAIDILRSSPRLVHTLSKSEIQDISFFFHGDMGISSLAFNEMMDEFNSSADGEICVSLPKKFKDKTVD